MAEGTKYDMVMLTTSAPISSDDLSFLYGLVLGYEIQPPIVMNSLVDNGYISSLLPSVMERLMLELGFKYYVLGMVKLFLFLLSIMSPLLLYVLTLKIAYRF